MKTLTTAQLFEQIGQALPATDWFTVTQQQIDQFAACTHDHQFIHVDVEKARRTPFGGTIAHGFLSLSMLSYFAQSFGVQLAGATMGINYGFDKVRFVTPVKAGSRIRCHATLADAVQVQPGQYKLTYDISVEIEDQPKPALVARWLGVQITEQYGAKNEH